MAAQQTCEVTLGVGRINLEEVMNSKDKQKEWIEEPLLLGSLGGSVCKKEWCEPCGWLSNPDKTRQNTQRWRKSGKPTDTPLYNIFTCIGTIWGGFRGHESAKSSLL